MIVGFKLKKILAETLVEASSLEKNKDIKITKINTPKLYQDMHLEIVLILDKEILAIEDGEMEKIEQINEEWGKILKKYFWLDN